MRIALACAFVLPFLLVDVVRAEPYTKVFINGRATPVYFNDGDSFRPMAGPYKGSQCRLAGFNTLESFGPAHSWGTWTEKEMWVLSKVATHHARHGVWHCETDGKKDGYGRLLMMCKDLALSHIEHGFAQVMTVDEHPGDPDLVAAQRRAIQIRAGMWAHGVPAYVLSSLHSKAEGGGKDGKTYNRLVSTWDGHSEKWIHEDDYAECQKVCNKTRAINDESKQKTLAALKADGGGKTAGDLDDATLARCVLDYATVGSCAAVPAARRAAIDKALAQLVSSGVLVLGAEGPDSCQVYVDFKRRYGGDRAVCLR